MLWLSHHAEFGDKVECLLDIQIERLQRRIDANLILIEALGLGDALEGLDGAADEVGDVVDAGEDLRIRVALDELEQLTVDDLYGGNLVGILIKDLVLAEHFVFFRNILLRECVLKLITPLLQLQNELIETLVNISSLLFVQPLNLSLDVVDKAAVVIVDTLRVDHQLVQVVDILLNDICHVLKLGQLVPIMVAEHAFWAYDGVAKLAEIFYFLVQMLEAVDFASLLMEIHRRLAVLIDLTRLHGHVLRRCGCLVEHVD